MRNQSIKLPFLANGAKHSTVTRDVPIDHMHHLSENGTPKIGDVILAKVTGVGYKKTLQNHLDREATLLEGDLIILSYGNRYAVSENEAIIPDDLSECHLASEAGVAATIKNQNEKMSAPTTIQPLGFICDKDNKVLNTKDYGLKVPKDIASYKSLPTIAVIGTGMDSGKTTSGASLVYGLTEAGFKVGFAKITGTGFHNDPHKPLDYGAEHSYDFVDAGWPSTYKIGRRNIEDIMIALKHQLALDGCDIIVMEIADGVLQNDNIDLLQSDLVKNNIHGVLLTAESSMGALSLTNSIRMGGYNIIGISGIVTSAPLASEEIKDSPIIKTLGIPCYNNEQLKNPLTAQVAHSKTMKRYESGTSGIGRISQFIRQFAYVR